MAAKPTTATSRPAATTPSGAGTLSGTPVQAHPEEKAASFKACILVRSRIPTAATPQHPAPDLGADPWQLSRVQDRPQVDAHSRILRP